jgi:hypothetical protein
MTRVAWKGQVSHSAGRDNYGDMERNVTRVGLISIAHRLRYANPPPFCLVESMSVACN